MEKISIVVPCFNEEDVINSFYNEIIKLNDEIKNVTFEYIFIDDGSKDNTLSIVKELSKKDKKVRFISFSRNFGKEAGMLAGLKYSTGDYTVVMDSDLQHDPKLIKDMYSIIKNEDYDSVAVKRTMRHGFRNLMSNMFFGTLDKLSSIESVKGEMDYRMMNRKMVDSIISLTEYNRFSKGIFSWVGFKTKWIEQPEIERVAGTSKWSFKDLLNYSKVGLTSFSVKPLKVASIFSGMFLIISLIFFIIVISRMIICNDAFIGFSLLCSILFFIGSTILFSIGVMCEYFGNMYLEVKNRPIYIVRETDDNE